MSAIRWAQDADGVVVLTLDDPSGPVNTLNAAFAVAMEEAVARLEAERGTFAGVVVTSAKNTMLVGGDLHVLRAVTRDDAAELNEHLRRVNWQLRRLETLGRPVVAAINGSALGAGLGICLACHHRIVVDDAGLELGFPDVTLGLLPEAGGVTRAVRLLGIADALSGLLLHGRSIGPGRALELGVVHEVVRSVDDLLPVAKAWIAASRDAAQPWDAKGYSIPGGTPASPQLAASLPALPANLRKQLKGANMPAPRAILAAAVEGAQVDFDNAVEIETRYFLELVTGQVAKNMIKGFYLDRKSVDGARGRPDGLERFRARKAVVLGAGTMGAVIAYICAEAGIDVVLKDVSIEAAELGKACSERFAAASGSQEILKRIHPTADPADAAGADLLIEAVSDNPAAKAQALAEIGPQLAPDTLLGSTTSALPISGLAEAVSRPEDFIGLHFCGQDDTMPLLEIVRGRRTSEATLHRALDLARQIRKTPIVVNDARGLFTWRVIETFINEGIAMLAERVPAATIEQASAQAGYPAPVLQLSDELGLEHLRRIRDAAGEAAGGEGRMPLVHPGAVVIDRLLDAGRAGRIRGAGFYDYEDGRRTSLWPGLRDLFPPIADPSVLCLKELGERMLFAEALESVRCLDEGVIETVAEANVGSLLGIGFPAWTGGVLQYIEGYEGGPAGFVERAADFADRFGERFRPPASLVERADTPGAATP